MVVVKDWGALEKVRLSTIFSDSRKLGWRSVENMASYSYLLTILLLFLQIFVILMRS